MGIKWLVRLGVLAGGLIAWGSASAAEGWRGDLLSPSYVPAESDEGYAADAALFTELIPGEPLAESELIQYYGKGTPTVHVGGDGVVNFSGDFTSNSANNFNVSGVSGIAQLVPVIGDNNNVNLSVEITINVNTVTVQNSNGSEIAVNQVLDFNGVFSGPFSQ